MSLNIPTEIDKNEFDKILKKLNKPKFSIYKSEIKENYKRLRTETKYKLKSPITNEECKNIDFFLKKIGYNNSFNRLDDVAENLR